VTVQRGEVTPAVVVRRYSRPDDHLIAEWDRLVIGTAGTDINQLSVWARIRALEGFTPIYLLAQRGPFVIGGAQILLRHLHGIGLVGYVSYGPIVPDQPDVREACVSALAVALADIKGVHMLFVQPAEGNDDVSQELLGIGFRPSSAGIAPTGSLRIDLTDHIEEIRGRLSSRLRYWTRRWADHGVTVRRGDEGDVPLLVELMSAAAAARGYSRPPRLGYLRTLYRELDATGNCALFIGEVMGMPVTADMVTMCGEMVRGRLGGFDRSGSGGRLSVPAAARWEMVRWAKESGYRWLDFGGLSEATLRGAVDSGTRYDQSWPAADRAKVAFGGTAYRYPPPVELIRPWPFRQAYDAISRMDHGRSLLHWARVWLRNRPQPNWTRSAEDLPAWSSGDQ
jgi:hypothetical protein